MAEYNDILCKLQAQCVKRECCSADMYKKALKELEGDADAAERLVSSLVSDKFVDDARYASAFAREKSSLAGWGPAKISYALRMKGVSRQSIDAALADVDPEKAGVKLLKVLQAKKKTLVGDPFIKFKLIKFALSRGYEYDKVASAVDEVLSEPADAVLE